MNEKNIGLISCSLLVVGIFCPLVRLPFVGSINYFNNSKGDGIFVLGFAILSIILIFFNKFKALFLTSLASLGLLSYTYIHFQNILTTTKLEMETSLSGNPFAGLADLAMQSVQLEWGWAILVIGSILLLMSAIISVKKPKLSKNQPIVQQTVVN